MAPKKAWTDKVFPSPLNTIYGRNLVSTIITISDPDLNFEEDLIRGISGALTAFFCISLLLQFSCVILLYTAKTVVLIF